MTHSKRVQDSPLHYCTIRFNILCSISNSICNLIWLMNMHYWKILI